jgi:4-hydroxy-2-oxoheptanedioate aldolase
MANEQTSGDSGPAKAENDMPRVTRPNAFREALRERPPLLGIWSMLNSANAVEGLGFSGFDWLLIDGEHSPVALSDAVDHLRALGRSQTIPIVRLASKDPVQIRQYLDAGANTIMLPLIQSASEARAAAAAMRYPPGGSRGVASMHRATRYGRVKDYLANASASLALIVQIESRVALDELEDIIAVDGVDAVFIGPSDLSADLGHLGHPDHPDVTCAIEGALKRAHRLGKPIGVLAPNAGVAQRHIRAGFDFVAIGSDAAILFGTADAWLAECRQVVAT